MSPALANRLRNRRSLLLSALAAVGLFLCLGCIPGTYVISSDVQSGVDDVQYLSTYGEWEDVDPYGMVWRPDVVPDWEPFYYGHWAWTSDGWAWVSYEPYGWLVYHYGYWDYEPGLGWFWVPGDTWSPAQVEWYTFGDYTAWAPLPPPNVYWPDPWEPYQTNVWIVVDDDRFTSHNVGRHRVKDLPHRDIIQRERPVNRPPDVRRVEILSKRTVPEVKIRREPINIRRQAIPAPPEQVRQPGEITPPRETEQPTLTRQPKEIQRKEIPPPVETQQPKEVRPSTQPQLEKMVLPDREDRKVSEYRKQVERQVLVPKRPAPLPPPQQPEKKKDTEENKKTRSR